MNRDGVQDISPSVEQVGNRGLGGSGYATEQDAVAAMPDIEEMERNVAEGRSPRERDEQGRFKKATEQTVQEDTGNTDTVEGDQESSGEADQSTDETQSADDNRSDEEKLVIELPPEEEGGQSREIDVYEALAAFEEAPKLRQQLEELQNTPAVPPQQWDQEIEKLVTERMQFERDLETIQQLIMPQQPDENLINPSHPGMDPEAYFEQKKAYEAQMEQFNTLQQARLQAQQKSQQQQQALQAVRMEREQAKLHEFWPEIKDERVAQEARDDAQKFWGFDDETVDSVVDSRFYALLQDGLKYRRGEAKAKQNVAKVKAIKPKLKRIKGEARQAQVRGTEKAVRNMHRNLGNEEAAMDALDGFLQDNDPMFRR